MGGWSIWHGIVVLIVVLLVFGTKRLTSGAKDLGKAVNEFKKGVQGDEEKPAQLSDQSRREGSAESQRNDDNVAR
jgi:sec-independent protein translocase protein TatA